MKRAVISSFLVLLFLISGLDLLVTGQVKSETSPSLPDNVNVFVTKSCFPCHTSTGGLLSRGKLNFTEWTQYSPEKQKEKAEKIYSVLKKGAMPPKSVRETRPEIIPTSEQIGIIKNWVESLNTDDK